MKPGTPPALAKKPLYRIKGKRARITNGPRLIKGLMRLQDVGNKGLLREFGELERMIQQNKPKKEVEQQIKIIKSFRAKRHALTQHYLLQEAKLTSRDKEFPHLLNREFFFSRLQKATQSEGYHTLVYMDIDELKKVNTLFGRKEGGLGFLTAFADSLAKVIPKARGFAGHIGGDEFLAYLPMPPRAARALLSTEFERARQEELKNWKMHPQARKEGLNLNYSAGLVGLRKGDAVGKAEVIADRLCSRAKTRGRERVTFAIRESV